MVGRPSHVVGVVGRRQALTARRGRRRRGHRCRRCLLPATATGFGWSWSRPDSAGPTVGTTAPSTRHGRAQPAGRHGRAEPYGGMAERTSMLRTRDDAVVPVDPSDYFALGSGELREVARFAVQGAEQVLDIFDRACPDDPRPRAAVEAAWVFANGAPRTNLQRTGAIDAHRAAKAAPTEAARHAAHAAGDAAAAAYLHPFAKASQVAHILRADAHAARAAELQAGDPQHAAQHIARAVARASPVLLGVLRQYPKPPASRDRVGALMCELDSNLRQL